MSHSPLDGCSILVVEDEPVTRMNIEFAFTRCGADVAVASSVKDASQLVDNGFSLGVLDHGLPDGEGTELYTLFHELGVPFIIHTGHEVPEGVRKGGVVVSKPARAEDLLSAAEALVAAPQLSETPT